MDCHCTEAQAQKLAGMGLYPALMEPCFSKYAGPDADGGLIPVLQTAQELYGYLPPDLLMYIANRMGVKPAKVIGVVTFYAQFRLNPVGKHLILLCQGTACHVNGSSGVEDAIRDHLGAGEGEITANGLFTYNNVACLGCCSLSPVMMIGARTYGGLTRDKAVKILQKIEQEDEKL